MVYNKKSPDSVAVASYYARQRHIPDVNKCGISPPDTVLVKWEDLDSSIKKPIRQCLQKAGREKILYIVFTYQTPYRLQAPLIGPHFALDQYVADIWDEYLPAELTRMPARQHPYFADAQTEGNVYQPFVSLVDYRSQPRALTIYSVWRLDGANPELARGLVEKAMAAETSGLKGQACFDRNRGEIANVFDTEYGSGDWDLHAGAEFARQAGFVVLEDQHDAEFGTPPVPPCPGAALYSGWYSLNHYNDAFTWNTGAVGFHLDSEAAVDPRGGKNWSANAIQKGITVTSGAVSEPYLEGMAHPDGVFRNLFEGANVGDAFLRNTRWLKWKLLNLGDPLYRPFPQGLPPFNLPSHTWSFLLLAPQVTPGGASCRAMVTLASPASAKGIVINLKSSAPTLAPVPESVTVPGGLRSASFSITTSRVGARTPVRIWASGGVNLSNTLVLVPLPGTAPVH